MGLVPEFFVLLGISIFLAMSLLSAFLDDDLPSRLQYVFQIAAIAGLAELLMSQGFVNLTRFWVSIVYLSFALSSVLGLNAYLAVVNRRIDMASTFSATLTVPTLMISALFVYSFLGSGGEVNLSPTTISTLSVLVFISSVSVFGFFREVSKRIGNTHGGPLSSLTGRVLTRPAAPEIDLPLRLPPMQREDWEKFLKWEMGEE